MSEFAPWSGSRGGPTGGNTGSRPDTADDGVATAAARSAVAAATTGHSGSSRVGGNNNNLTASHQRRRGSAATALVIGRPDSETHVPGWTRGTVPDCVDLIVLSEDDLALAPPNFTPTPASPVKTSARGPPNAADEASNTKPSTAALSSTTQSLGTTLPTLAASSSRPQPPGYAPGEMRSPVTTRGVNAAASGSPQTARGPGPSARGGRGAVTARGARGAQGRKRRKKAATEAADPVDTFVVPRSIGDQVTALRQLQTSWPTDGGSAHGSSPLGGYHHAAPPGSAPGPPLLSSRSTDRNHGSPRLDAPQTSMHGSSGLTIDVNVEAAIETSPAQPSSANNRVGNGAPPRVLPTVRLSPPRREYNAASPRGPQPPASAAGGVRSSGQPLGAAPFPVLEPTPAEVQKAALSWYRTEVALLRDQVDVW